MTTEQNEFRPDLEIAVVGMAGRFPGAKSVAEFWLNLIKGVESISTFTDEQLKAFGVSPSIYRDPDFVKAAPVLEGIGEFDAEFFGYSPREAKLMDPQHRLFLECAWEALEFAGYSSADCPPLTGIYAGTSLSSYLLYNILPNLRNPHADDSFQAMIGNDKDFLCTRVSYKLNLRGPSVTVQSGCSTSLVAVHLACQSLLSYQCDLALSGGVSVQVPVRTGYLYQRGGLNSSDGHCRAFDAKAEGTLFGSGVGVVVLKRLSDALEAHDSIYAVIKGGAVNNDGNHKVGYTAPSIAGQTAVIRASHALAEITPQSLGYIECHGTGTVLGDPIEVQALTDAFNAPAQTETLCAIGSVKTNIGHLDAASGVAGLLKAVLALNHKLIPPSLHFETPNPKIDFENNPFRVSSRLSTWETNGAPRRAAVSSFGIGGTNAHIILQEAPMVVASPSRAYKLLVLSARTKNALEQQTINLAAHLKVNRDQDMADIAFTTQVGRNVFEYRRAVVCQEREDAIASLENLDPERVVSRTQKASRRSVIFMFPGGGAQYVNMAADLYRTEPFFRKQLDSCAELLNSELGVDLRSYLYPEEESQNSTFYIRQTSIGLPALFIVEYALAKLLVHWGIKPDGFIGHSLGEYVAACLAGVFSLKDALSLVLMRSRLLQKVPKGGMVSVALSKTELEPLLSDRLWIAAINGPAQSVVSGTLEAVDEFIDSLNRREIDARRIPIDVSSHSGIVEPILPLFRDFLRTLEFHSPELPYLSNVTGTWIRPEEATDPEYWVRHLRSTVLFSDGIAELCKTDARLLLEIGPGHTLASLARAQLAPAVDTVVVTSLRHPYDKKSDVEFIMGMLCKLWTAGVIPNWCDYYAEEIRLRVPLPTYPFERKQYWIDLPHSSHHEQAVATRKEFDIDQWFNVPSWRQSPAPVTATRDGCFLIFVDDAETESLLVDNLRLFGKEVITVQPGSTFRQLSEEQYEINVTDANDYLSLLQFLRRTDHVPTTLVHTLSLGKDSPDSSQAEHRLIGSRKQGFYSVLFLVQAIVEIDSAALARLCVVTAQSQQVESIDTVSPEKALLRGLCKVVSQEYETIQCSLIDLTGGPSGVIEAIRSGALVREIMATNAEPSIVLRGSRRWTQGYERCALQVDGQRQSLLRRDGVYLITGGLGKVGLILAEHLFKTRNARLILTTRKRLPRRVEWENWLLEHGEHPDSSTVRKLLALETEGAHIRVITADVSDFAQMYNALTDAKREFGEIQGVFHLAGHGGKQAVQLIPSITPEDSESQFKAKLDGTSVLSKLFQSSNLDFVLLFSSNAAVLGGMGLASYAAANSTLDAFAEGLDIPGKTRWISVNWDKWGIENSSIGSSSALDTFAMTMEEGLKALEKILLSTPGAQVIVSPGDLSSRLRLWIKNDREADSVDPFGSEETSSHIRPALETDYASPENEIEEKVAGLWQDLLDVDRVGRHDNFFELGGNSLIALKMVSRIHKELRVKLPVVLLFESPTVSALAKRLAGTRDEQNDGHEDKERGSRRRQMTAETVAS